MELVYEKNVSGLRIHAGGGDANLISLNEFVQIADSSVKIETAPGGDYGFAFDVAKARQLVGWAPAVSIRERIPVIANNIRAEITEPS
jgi:nucleoside-diphosphate-sugar epimerase